eukprot:scaffold168108_cov26-Tisochrysis_lutea.AAC.1
MCLNRCNLREVTRVLYWTRAAGRTRERRGRRERGGGEKLSPNQDPGQQGVSQGDRRITWKNRGREHVARCRIAPIKGEGEEDS